MTKSLISRKQVHGEVEFNDGEFAEIQTVGIEGIEKDLRTCYYKPSRSIVAIRAIPANSSTRTPSWIVADNLYNNRGHEVGFG